MDHRDRSAAARDRRSLRRAVGSRSCDKSAAGVAAGCPALTRRQHRNAGRDSAPQPHRSIDTNLPCRRPAVDWKPRMRADECSATPPDRAESDTTRRLLSSQAPATSRARTTEKCEETAMARKLLLPASAARLGTRLTRRDQHVTGAANAANLGQSTFAQTELATQVAHVSIDTAVIWRESTAQHTLSQRLARLHLTDRTHQHFEQSQLGAGQPHR